MGEADPKTMLGEGSSLPLANLYTDWELCIGDRGERDPELVREIVQFARIPSGLLERLLTRPLVLGRQVATLTSETTRFLELARRLKRPPLMMTMTDDRFTPAVNEWKRRIVKLQIEGRHQTRNVTLVPFQRAEMLRFREICCTDGTPLVKFHLDMIRDVLGADAVAAVYDASAFFASCSLIERYERFFALFTCLGVLAESYVPAGAERALVETAVLPAFERTIARFGCRPRIVRLLPEGDELHPRWDRYPASMLAPALRTAGRPRAALKVAQ